MEQPHNGSTMQQFRVPNTAQRNLPNANLTLILGILSVLLCWWHFVSFAGIILALVSLVLANKDTTLYRSNPEQYTLSSLNNIKTGRTCAIIGLIISVIVFVFVILLVIGIIAVLPFWGMIR
jgi:small-conductance mechanosensitive channel